MRKIYSAVLLLTVFTIASNAQTRFKDIPYPEKPTGTHISKGLQPPNTTGDCDTTYLADALNDWSAVTYTTSASKGYIFGVLPYPNLTFRQSGNFYDLSGSSSTFISGVTVRFNHANSSNSAELNKLVYFRVYEDVGGFAGNELGNTSVTFATIKSALTHKDSSIYVAFAAPIALPDSKQFYVTVDYSLLKWAGTTRDSLAIASSLDDETAGIAVQDIAEFGGIVPVNSVWGSTDNPLDVSLWIFPWVSSSEAGCTALPVKLLSFNAERKSNDVTLSWKISSELNMNRYEVERADNTGSFKTVATVKSLNSFKEQTYTATDRNAFNAATTVQYRLKQVDGDGSVSYSRVINVKSNNAITDVTFMNPFTGDLKIQLNLATAQAVSLSLYDMQGKLVASQKSKMYDAASSTIILNNTANLKSGMYVLKLNAGTEQAVYKVVKQ